MRPKWSVRGLALLATLILLFTPDTRAEEITIASASPYQLADLLSTANPIYDVTIAAELLYPSEIKDKMPALVFMHGSGGRLARHQRYLELARDRGFVTLQLDSFGPRGVTSTVGNQTNVTAAMMATDVLRALTLLAARPDIDPTRIVIMGSSKGAIAALFAAWSPVREKVAGTLDYAGYILLYPFCAAIEDGRVTANPVHVFIGEMDNWTPAAPCIAQVERMKRLGRNWSITLYDDAYHGFDAQIDGVRSMPHAYSMVDCGVALRADGYEYETGSGFLLTKAERPKAFRSCAKKGAVKMGALKTDGEQAADTLLRDVGTFLDDVNNEAR